MDANDLTKFCIEIRCSKLDKGGHNDRTPGSVYNKWRDWNDGAEEYSLGLPQYTKNYSLTKHETTECNRAVIIWNKIYKI